MCDRADVDPRSGREGGRGGDGTGGSCKSIKVQVVQVYTIQVKVCSSGRGSGLTECRFHSILIAFDRFHSILIAFHGSDLSQLSILILR